MTNLQNSKPAQTIPRRLKPALQNILTLLLSAVLFFAALEAVLRIAARGAENANIAKHQALKRESEFIFYEYDRELGWKNKPLAEGDFTTPDSKTFVRINSKGLRDEEHDYKKPPGIFRILVLGDSFAWGYGVEQGRNFTDQLEMLLGKPVEVINAGVSGYGTDQELILLEKEGMKYEPDLALVAFASNDFMRDNVSSRYGIYSKPYFTVENGALKPMNFPLPELAGAQWNELLKNWKPEEKTEKRKGLKRFLKYNTKSYPFLSQSLKDLRYSILRSLSMNPQFGDRFAELRRNLSNEDADLLVTREIFLRMKEVSASGHARLAVFAIPYKSALEKLPNPYISAFLDFFEEQGIPSSYPYEAFYRKFRSGEKIFLTSDDHWTESGHTLAAEEIAQFLKSQDLIP